MAIEVLSQTINLNETATFKFNGPVLSNVVGISNFSFTYGSKDHHVQKISLSIQTSWSENTVRASVTAQLVDASGNLIDKGSSKVGLVCVANTVTTDSDLALATRTAIGNGAQSAGIDLPGASLKFAQPGIAGFSLSYGTKDHHLREILVTLGFTQHGTSGNINASAEMTDSDGNAAAGQSADGILVAGNYSEDGMLVAMLTNQQTGTSQEVTFDKGLSSAVVLLNAFTITFKGDDHHVKTIGAGCSGWSVKSSDPKKVVINDARAFVSDNSGNTQNDSESSVNLVVVGIPAS